MNISSSASPREQNVALGIKLFNYSVSYRLANLKLSHLAPWTHQWYVCLHIRACVGPGVCRTVAACERSVWKNVILGNRLHLQSAVVQLRLVFMHAVVCGNHITFEHFSTMKLAHFTHAACHRELWVKLLFTVQGSSCAYLTVLPGSIGSFIGENGYIASMKHTPQNRSSISYTIYFVWQGSLVFKTACRSVCFQCNRTV